MPNAYELGDGITVDCLSEPFEKVKGAKEQVAFGILELLLVSRPNGVHLDPNSLWSSVGDIRAAANATAGRPLRGSQTLDPGGREEARGVSRAHIPLLDRPARRGRRSMAISSHLDRSWQC